MTNDMTDHRLNRIARRWSLLAAVFAALYWGVWYLVTGFVPAVTDIPIWLGQAVTLPFEVSRWWDVVAAPIFVQAAVWLYRRVSDPWACSLGAVQSLVLGLAIGLVFGIATGLACATICYLAFGLVERRYEGVATALEYALAAGLTVGFVHGFVFGLVVALFVGLVIVLLNVRFVAVVRLLSFLGIRMWRWIVAAPPDKLVAEAPAFDRRRVRLSELRREVSEKEAEIYRIESEQAAEEPQPYRRPAGA